MDKTPVSLELEANILIKLADIVDELQSKIIKAKKSDNINQYFIDFQRSLLRVIESDYNAVTENYQLKQLHFLNKVDEKIQKIDLTINNIHQDYSAAVEFLKMRDLVKENNTLSKSILGNVDALDVEFDTVNEKMELLDEKLKKIKKQSKAKF